MICQYHSNSLAARRDVSRQYPSRRRAFRPLDKLGENSLGYPRLFRGEAIFSFCLYERKISSACRGYLSWCQIYHFRERDFKTNGGISQENSTLFTVLNQA